MSVELRKLVLSFSSKYVVHGFITKIENLFSHLAKFSVSTNKSFITLQNEYLIFNLYLIHKANKIFPQRANI